jgi:hypothetical protein
MSGLNRLLEAKSETEFFIILCNSVFQDLRYIPGQEDRNAVVRAEIIRTDHPQHGDGLTFVIDQLLHSPTLKGRTLARRENTHIFSLYADNTLTWWMLDQPLRTGLTAIQEGLRDLRSSLEQDVITDPGQKITLEAGKGNPLPT